MSLETDVIVDRRRMRRKLTFWRVLAVFVAIVGVIAVAAIATRQGAGLLDAGYVARVKIQGLIRNDSDRVESLDRLGRSRAKAVIVHIDSPGGTTAGSEQLHEALRRLADKKPLVVVVDGLAASGGYIAAMAAEYIVAQDTSLVGSIGVLFQYPKFGDLLNTIGIRVEQIKSTPLKAAPDTFEPTSREARAAMEAVVLDVYAWFRKLVKERRRLDDAALDRAADGRIFTGRQGLELKLIDELGNEETAREWLAKTKGVELRTPVRNWQLRSRFGDLSFLHLAAAAALDAIGLNSLARRIDETGTIQAVERLNLDGLLALWHPQATN